jgi:tRNA-splicing ligase RtcB
MRALRDLHTGENIAVVPYAGVEYEEPPEATILDLADIRRMLKQCGRPSDGQSHRRIVERLVSRHLVPLTYRHAHLPALLRIMGMVFGDASMGFIGARKDGMFHFSGKAEDLERIRKDLQAIGYTPGPVHWRTTRLFYRGSERKYRNAFFNLNASSFVVLLAALGVPIGRKVAQPSRIPPW